MTTLRHPTLADHWLVGDILVGPCATSEAAEQVVATIGLGGGDPPLTADDVRAEASRRMRALVGARDEAHLDRIIVNGSREAIRLLRLKDERPWTAEEEARAAALSAIDAAIEAIRAASNMLEARSPVPADYADDSRWP